MNQPRYHEIGVCGMCRRTFRADRLAGGLCPECRERNRPREASAADLVRFDAGASAAERRRHAQLARAGRGLAARTPEGPVMWCVDCGRAFPAKRANARRCPGCRAKLAAERQHACYVRRRDALRAGDGRSNG